MARVFFVQLAFFGNTCIYVSAYVGHGGNFCRSRLHRYVSCYNRTIIAGVLLCIIFIRGPIVLLPPRLSGLILKSSRAIKSLLYSVICFETRGLSVRRRAGCLSKRLILKVSSTAPG